jgi:Zn-dependent protease
MELVHLLIGLGVLLFSTTVRESVHAVTAAWFGDPTALQQGRATLNPWKHLDPFWTLLMPVILFIVSSGSMVFGMARPVPIRSEAFRASGLGVVMTLAAGLAVNLMIAAFAFSALLVLHHVSPALVRADSVNAYFIYQVIFINLLIVVINIVLPIPPLDSSRLVRHWMNPRGRAIMDAAEPFGVFAVMLLLCLLFVTHVMDPMYDGMQAALGWIFDPDYASGLIRNLRGGA